MSEVLPSYIREILSALENAGYEAYVVGGAVRDFIRGTAIHDFDISSSALPEQTTEVMEALGYRKLDIRSDKFGTVVFISPDDNSERVEITSFRGEEGYEDCRHPDKISLGKTLEEDAARRDFTINALYMDKDGFIKDPMGGKADIEARVIRACGDPGKRFKEDALRILRAVRFEAKIGFALEERTREAAKNLACELKHISAERILVEMNGIVTGPFGPQAIRDNLEVIGAIIPELLLQKDFDQKSKYHDRSLLEHTLDTLSEIPLGEDGKRDLNLSWAALLHDIGKPEVFTLGEDGVGHMKGHSSAGKVIAQRIANELRMPCATGEEIVELVQLHDAFPDTTAKSARRFLSRYGEEFCRRLLILQRADILAHSEIGRQRIGIANEIERLYDEAVSEGVPLTAKALVVDGRDVISWGIPEGPEVGRVLHSILENVVDGTLPNDRGAIENYVRKFYE